MNHSFKTILLFFAYSSSILSQGQSVLIGDNYSEYIQNEISYLGPKANIMLDQYVFTFDPMRQTLAQEVANGAWVSINMYRSHSSNPSTYYFFEDLNKLLPVEAQQRLALNKYPGKYTLHTKHLSWQQGYNCACHLGSHNLTNLASQANKELMVATYDDFDVYQQCKEFHDSIAYLSAQVYDYNKEYLKTLNQITLTEIPASRMVMTSLKHEINKSLISFIQKLNQGGYALIGAYSMNDIYLIQAICDAADRGAKIMFFIDGQTINTKTEFSLLKQLHEHNVNIFLYNYDGSKKYSGYAKKMHAKFYAAQQPGQPTVVAISTRNFTKQFGLNMCSIHPNDEALFNSLYSWCDELAYECDTYESVGLSL